MAKSNQAWPVYELRPLPNSPRVWVRYADGQWLPDDGEYDIAWASMIYGPPYALYVDLPYQRNIVWSWYDTSWGATEPRHPRGNAWHYMLREGTKTWGGDWKREQHPNVIAGRTAMDWVASQKSCANGIGARFSDRDDYIKAGLVRERESKRVVAPPSPRVCMYCGPIESPEASDAVAGTVNQHEHPVRA